MTTREFEIQGLYEGYGKRQAWATVTTEQTMREARTNLRLYRENEPGTRFRLRITEIKRYVVRIGADDDRQYARFNAAVRRLEALQPNGRPAGGQVTLYDREEDRTIVKGW